PLHEVAPQVDPALVAIVERALKKNPEERYADAGEMAMDIRAVRLRLLEGAVTSPVPMGALSTVVWEGDGPQPIPTLTEASASTPVSSPKTPHPTSRPASLQLPPLPTPRSTSVPTSTPMPTSSHVAMPTPAPTAMPTPAPVQTVAAAAP